VPLFGFAYSTQALANLKTIPAKFRKQIVNRVQDLASNPHPHNCKVVQNMMDGEDKVYRVRSGDYRILYSVRTNPDQIVVLDIDHRKDVYR
jgi:mRNA interferase RelE/StbE